jgi:hypothetical protein
MKTVKFFFAAAALSLLFVSCQKETIAPQSAGDGSIKASTVAMSAVTENNGVPGVTKNVRYVVNVNLSLEKSLCNRYQVVVLGANGKEVAEPQAFDPSISTYNFYENTRLESGIRVARLVLVPWVKHFACETELYTAPVATFIEFRDGDSYTFELFPNTNPPKEKE